VQNPGTLVVNHTAGKNWKGVVNRPLNGPEAFPPPVIQISKVGVGASLILPPQSLGVCGKAFIQPDVRPGVRSQAVTKPLVAQLVDNEPVGASIAVNGMKTDAGDSGVLHGSGPHEFRVPVLFPLERIASEVSLTDIHHFTHGFKINGRVINVVGKNPVLQRNAGAPNCVALFFQQEVIADSRD